MKCCNKVCSPSDMCSLLPCRLFKTCIFPSRSVSWQSCPTINILMLYFIFTALGSRFQHQIGILTVVFDSDSSQAVSGSHLANALLVTAARTVMLLSRQLRAPTFQTCKKRNNGTLLKVRFPSCWLGTHPSTQTLWGGSCLTSQSQCLVLFLCCWFSSPGTASSFFRFSIEFILYYLG